MYMHVSLFLCVCVCRGERDRERSSQLHMASALIAMVYHGLSLKTESICSNSEFEEVKIENADKM